MREQIAFMESDDDIRYTVLGQCVLREYGGDFRSTHVAHVWMDRLPYRHVCTAEMQAYRNLAWRCDGWWQALTPQRAAELDRTIDWHWITHHVNPYREWIGAQIRCDSYGYAAPGWPQKAAEMAWRDAHISHVKNGIYGSMFCAAMIAAAFALDDPLAIVEAGLARIPQRSRLYADVQATVDLCRAADFCFDRFEQVLDSIYQRLGHYHPVHTNNNAALVAAALLLGGGDVERSITLAVMGGWDTDCNGATVGSIVGAMRGGKRIPAHWSGPLHDTLHARVIDYHPVAISQCARWSLSIARGVLGIGDG